MASQENARKLLERLASDDDFRTSMESDPAAAFAEYGFVIDRAITPGKVKLPTKEEISASSDLLSQQIEATNGWIVFCR